MDRPPQPDTPASVTPRGVSWAHVMSRIEWHLSYAALSLASLYALATLVIGQVVNVPETLLDVLYCSVSVLAGVLCLWRARRAGLDRNAWRVIGIGLSLHALGNAGYQIFVPLGQPAPAWVNLLHLAMFPLAYTGIYLLVRRQVMGLSVGNWLDGFIGGLGISAIACALAFGSILNHLENNPLTMLTLLAFVSGDLLILMFVTAAASMFDWRLNRSWKLLIMGFLLFTLADTIDLINGAGHSYRPGSGLENAWMAAMLLVAFAASPTDRLMRARRVSGATMIMPQVFGVSSLAILTFGGITDRGSTIAINLAGLTLLLALGRLTVALHELRLSAHDRALARTDELTGLPNRRAFSELLTRDLTRAQEGRVSPARAHQALLLIDLDRFKEVNDTLGHTTGDLLLRQAGQRMHSQLQRTDTLARWGGDEFAVLLSNAGKDEAVKAAQGIVAALRTPYLLDGLTLHMGGSVGIALYPDHANDSEELLRRADVAMYEAKSHKDSWTIYNPDTDQHTLERLEMLEHLRHAFVAQDQMVLHYQPKANLRTGEVVGVEALVRWNHPTQGLLYPDAFLPLVESFNLMLELTVCVLRQAIIQCKEWMDQGWMLPVAVNLSPSQVVDDELPDVLANFLAEAGLPARMLEVEITEDFLLNDRARARSVLTRIRDLGITVSVDDYGTGYSSLAYLRDLPVDQLKLDRSFVTPMSADPGAAAIVKSTVALAHSLGLTMVAEGVEDHQAWDALEQYGCDHAQGYWLCRPVPTTALIEWLRSREAAGAYVGLRAEELDASVPAVPQPRTQAEPAHPSPATS